MPRSLRSNSSSSQLGPPPQTPQQSPQQTMQVGGNLQTKEQKPSTPEEYKLVKLRGTALETKFLHIRPFYTKIFNMEEWDLSDRLFRDEDMKVAFKFIQQCDATILRLDYNKYSSIIKCIANTSFPSLIDLYLGDNTIYSVQLLSTINMPSLQYLHLNDNPICELKALRKCNLPNLKKLSLKDIRVFTPNSLIAVVQLSARNLESVMLNYREENLCERNWPWLKKTDWNYKWKKNSE